MRYSLLQFFLHVVIFVVLRYLSITIIFLKGIKHDDKYSIWDYAPALLIQIVFLFISFFKENNNIKRKNNKAKLYIIFILLIIFFASHFRLIPHWLVPY